MLFGFVLLVVFVLLRGPASPCPRFRNCTHFNDNHNNNNDDDDNDDDDNNKNDDIMNIAPILYTCIYICVYTYIYIYI